MNVIVTGANRGIGREISSRMLQEGHNVWACVRESDGEWLREMQSFCRRDGQWIRPVVWSGLTDRDSVRHAAGEITGSGFAVDGLVNNAGVTSTSTYMMTSMEEMKNVFEVNLFGTLLFTQYIAKKMIRQKNGGGKIVNIASVRGIKPEAGNISYGTSKAALIYATKVLAIELADYNIKVNAVAPGMIPTDINASKSEKLKDRIMEETALRRFGEQKDVANAVLWLLHFSNVSGQVICVDGGYV